MLAERKTAICARWLDAVLQGYGPETALRWRRVHDPFANPVGHAFSTGLPLLFDAVAGTGDPSPAAMEALEQIVRIRSVQDLPASQAVGFLLLLREAIRAEAPSADLAEINVRIEALLLRAFDLHLRFREQLLRIRQEELKRSVASMMRRWHEETGDTAEQPAELIPLGVGGR